MQSEENDVINELLTLGVLTHKNGQLMVSDNFFLVLLAEGFVANENPREKIIRTIYRFVPTAEKERVLTYVAMVEGYLLQN